MTESTLEGYCQLEYLQSQLSSNFHVVDLKQSQSTQKGFKNNLNIETNFEEHLNNTQHQYPLLEENKGSSSREEKRNGRQMFGEDSQQTNKNLWPDEFIKGIYHKLQVILKPQSANWEEQKICGNLLDDILSFMEKSDDKNFQHLLRNLCRGRKILKARRKYSENRQNKRINLSAKFKEDFFADDDDDDEVFPEPNNHSPKPFPEEKIDTITISINGDISNIVQKSAPYKKLKSEPDHIKLTSSSNLENQNMFSGLISSGLKKVMEFISPTNDETSQVSKLQTSNSSQKARSRKSVGLKNLGQTCYMNALFQCLYQIEPFRQAFYRSQTSIYCSLDESLAKLFYAIEKKWFSREVNKELQNLVNFIYQTRKEFQPRKSGDSCALLRAILEELSIGSSLEHSPYSKMFFGGPLIKTLVCQACEHEKKIQETMQIFQVQDIHFSKEKEETFFKSLTEKRFCPCNQRQNIFDCSYSATFLPEVLVIKIHDTIDSKTNVKALKRLSLLQSASSDGKLEKMIEYELTASVLNFNKGENGFHSIALVREEEEYYVYDDNYWYSESYSLNCHPQLLFYSRVVV